MNSKNLVVRYGLILAAVAIVYSLIINTLGLGTNQSAGYVGYLIMPIVLYFGMNNANSIWEESSFGKLFGFGFKVCALASIAVGIFAFVYFNYINPELIGEMVQMAEDKLYNDGSYSEDQIEAAVKIQKMFMTPGSLALMGVFGYLFFGTIFSLIMAAILKPKVNKEY